MSVAIEDKVSASHSPKPKTKNLITFIINGESYETFAFSFRFNKE
jgi:hypothetical protein